jgi:hypothetical protein
MTTEITKAELAEALAGHEEARRALRTRAARIDRHIKRLTAQHAADLNPTTD